MYVRLFPVKKCHHFCVLMQHAKMGGPQISSANRKSENQRTSLFFRFADLPQMQQFRDLRFVDLRFVDLRFADSIIFCGLKTSANPQIHNFLLTNLRICDSRTGSPQIFEDLPLRNKPKNLWIAICGLTKNICVVTFDNTLYINAYNFVQAHVTQHVWNAFHTTSLNLQMYMYCKKKI